MAPNLWFKREFYLEKILKYLDNIGLIKVLIGQRRAGKSYIMKQIMDFLLKTKEIHSTNVVYINLEIDYLKFNSVSDLDAFVQSRRSEAKWPRLYLFLDEIQELTGWEKLLNSYRADDNFDVDIFITGSNANLLSSELSTYLAGRYIDFEIFPFDYREYLGYWKLENTTTNFLSYLNSTGISELYKIPDDEGRVNFLKSLKDTIILKDIVKRYRIKDVDFLEKLFSYLSGNIGNLFSFNSIVKKLKGIHIDSNAVTIGNYLQYLEKTYVIHACQRYDLKGKKILEWEKKYYLNDLAFNNYFSSSYDIGSGRKLENIVYNYLRSHGYAVYVGYVWDNEIDFIAENGTKKMYIQVAYLIADEKVFQREFGNLQMIRDNYPKYVVSLDEILVKNHEGIIHLNVKDFLLSENL